MRMVCRVESRSDLYRVCFKAPDARVEIPELEFEIGADQKNRIDTIYNHIGAAILNLGRYVAQASPAELNDDNRNKIVDTITLLNILLDVERPWTFIVHDPKVRRRRRAHSLTRSLTHSLARSLAHSRRGRASSSPSRAWR